MDSVKQRLLELAATYNGGQAVSYPVLDRKRMAFYPDLGKAGCLGAVLDEMVTEKLLEQTDPSTDRMLPCVQQSINSMPGADE